MNKKIYNSFVGLKHYCEIEKYKGYDPYDGLNSRLFKAMPFMPKWKISKLAWIQFFKRSPLNLRKLVGVKKEENPKAMGLFLSSFCQLYKADPKQEYVDKAKYFIEKILNSTSPGYSGACWGYNFDWEARAFFQPKGTPTVVASVFVASSLLDAYELWGDEKLLKTARSTCDFVLKDLNRTYDKDGNFSFSYSKMDTSVVFNASLLGSRLLSRVYYYTKEPLLKEEARKSVAFCCGYQQKNGAWAYGTYDFHQWIDNFHTGYNLECIHDYARFTGDISFNHYIDKGFEYYINTFFTEEGVPRYYSNSTYPIDVHAPAQMVITLCKLNKVQQHRKLMEKVLYWTIDHMQSSKGYFYYQINKYFTSKIPYMRWSQSWMFYAFSTYLNYSKNEKG